MVVSAESLATAAGVEILKNGGNAVDAAVAVGFTLAVTYPEAGNIGGGGFMLFYLAGGGTTMIDFRESAPAAATRDMYLDRDGNPVPEKSLVGPLAAGVPGTVSGLLEALESYGSKARHEVLRRPIQLAEGGFPISERLAASLAKALPSFITFSSSAKAFTKNGVPYKAGEVLKQPDLARTLKAIRDRGQEGFYTGEVAHMIVNEMQQEGGIISEEDLLDYEVAEREPVRGSYRSYDVISSSPPAAGGVALIEMLNILEGFDIQGKASNSPAAIHLIASAAKLAYADRAEYAGDPDYVEVPVDVLISKQYGTELSTTINSAKATPSDQIRPGVSTVIDEHETTHYCVVDSFGNVVSATITLNDLYGCKVVVDGAGFFLNNEMDDFVAKPGSPNFYGLVGSEANAIAPGKRMVSSMTPTILLKGERPFLVLGARGGSRITTTVAQIIINVVDFGLDIQEAVGLPRVHHQWLPDKLYYEPQVLGEDVLDDLRGMGYVVEELTASPGRAQAIIVDDGYFLGWSDPREGGAAIGF
jgi:gamma-glutamyltranspeptidase/glutathione hydrolase